MSPHELATGVHADRQFLSVPVYNRIVAFLALARLLCNPKNLIASGFFFDRGLRLGRQVLHIYRSLLLCLCGNSDTEAGATVSAVTNLGIFMLGFLNR